MSASAGGLVIDWTQMPTYNTIMGLSAGAGLLLVVQFGRAVARNEKVVAESWALAAGVLGAILTVTGAHMTLTWPFAKYFPFDNIIFGETSLAFGALLLAAALYLWKRATAIETADDLGAHVARVTKPLGIFVFALGLALIGIAAAGIVFQLFAAPPQEPISGLISDHPAIEATGMSSLFGLVGVGAVLFPFMLGTFSSHTKPTALQQLVGLAWTASGLAFMLFSALNFFTHIGLVVHTMG